MKIRLLLALVVFSTAVYGKPITIDNPNEYYILDYFFRSMLEDESFGYVLEGEKPLSALNIYPLNSLLKPDSLFFEWSVLAHEAIEVWNQLNPTQQDYIFKPIKEHNLLFGGPYYELLFINRQKTQEVIEKNLDLFRFYLSPTLTTASLAKLISDSSQSLDKIIHSNNALMGILLGYGTFNSLMGGRLEELIGAHGIPDLPPLQTTQVNDVNFPSYLLAYTDTETTVHKVAERLSLQPGLCFETIQDEIDKILTLKTSVPKLLLREKPAFIFGAYEDKDNEQLFQKIRSEQLKILNILSKDNCLNYVLEKITGERPIINCELSGEPKLPINEHAEEAIAYTIWQMAQSLDSETVSIFVDTFCSRKILEDDEHHNPILPGVFTGLKQAKYNLSLAEEQMSSCSKNQEFVEITPQRLYYKTCTPGEGKPLEAQTDLLMSYVIKNCLGHTLSAQHKSWIDLSSTITGFAHGLKGIKEGETRIIYVHPEYGYGAVTTLSPCVSLKVKVTLYKISDHAQRQLPPLTPIDLGWVKDSEFFNKIKASAYANSHYLGKVWGDWLSTSKDVNFAILCKMLKQLYNGVDFPKFLTDQERKRIANRIFWNLISSKKKKSDLVL